jgi:hypothetical protein
MNRRTSISLLGKRGGRKSGEPDRSKKEATAGRLVGRTRIDRCMRALRVVLIVAAACIIAGLIGYYALRAYSVKRVAEWCANQGYSHYATNDGFCIGPGGKLVEAQSGVLFFEWRKR